MRQFLILFSFLLAVIPTNSEAEVWPSQNEWSQDWENEYAKWVEHDWNEKIFKQKESDVAGIKTDCADAAYAMRMTFSFERGLPFKIYNKGTDRKFGKYLSNELPMFDSKYPDPPEKKYLMDPNTDKNSAKYKKVYLKYISDLKDVYKKRFRAFLNYVLANTNSNTLPEDTYPIAINRDSLKPGTIYVSPDDHTMEIQSVNTSGIAKTMWSTVPSEVRQLEYTLNWPFYMPEKSNHHRDGYRAFKEPKQFDEVESSLPNYSLEQFDIAERSHDNTRIFIDEIASKMKVNEETINEKVNRVFANLCQAVHWRSREVLEALNAQEPKYCFDSDDYYKYSTPNRDDHIFVSFSYVKSLTQSPEYQNNISSIQRAGQLEALFSNNTYYDNKLANLVASHILKSPSDLNKLNELINSESLRSSYGLNSQQDRNDLIKLVDLVSLNWACEIKTHSDSIPVTSLRNVYQAQISKQLIADPNATAEQRWGLEKEACENEIRAKGLTPKQNECSSNYHPSCPQY